MAFSLENPEATILIVEEEPNLRQLLKVNLERSGAYSLIFAEDGQNALRLAADHKGSIDLLISTFQMQGMTGADLARELRLTRPDVRALLIAAFPQGLLVLDSGWKFLQKPFLPSAILDRVRDVLINPLHQKTHSS